MLFPGLEDVTLEALSLHTLMRGPGKGCAVQGGGTQSLCPLGAPPLWVTFPH